MVWSVGGKFDGVLVLLCLVLVDDLEPLLVMHLELALTNLRGRRGGVRAGVRGGVRAACMGPARGYTCTSTSTCMYICTYMHIYACEAQCSSNSATTSRQLALIWYVVK